MYNKTFKQLGASARLVDGKSKKYFATLQVVCNADYSNPLSRKDLSIAITGVTGPSIVLSLDNANKLASEILKTTRNLKEL